MKSHQKNFLLKYEDIEIPGDLSPCINLVALQMGIKRLNLSSKVGTSEEDELTSTQEPKANHPPPPPPTKKKKSF